jgi:3'-phosphoadenosine 5'-phosphosulfate sulfotransferase (PAPS reductase)/FAD synthetase
MNNEKVRHILSLSGGKDSTALAIYMKDKIPGVEYVFCDTGEELKETYEYLDKVEAYLGQEIIRLKNKRQGFKDLLEMRRGFLPSQRMRWCTQYLKIQPFEEFVGDDTVISYIAIRADETHRKGYISTKPNIQARYPFIEDSLRKDDILRILEESGLGLPEYYKWRSRSGCYFCFYQQRNEWVGLLENHPTLFWAAAAYEKLNPETGERYTWSSRESLEELAKPERVAEIKREHEKRKTQNRFDPGSGRLVDIFSPDENEDAGCLVCHL